MPWGLNVNPLNALPKITSKTIIQKMYRNNTWRSQIKRSCIVPYGGTAGQPLGYAIGFTVPEGAGTGIFKEGKTYTFVVSGIAKEEIDYTISVLKELICKLRKYIRK